MADSWLLTVAQSVPSGEQLVKMLVDDGTHFAQILGAKVIGVGGLDVSRAGIQPELAFHPGFLDVDMGRFMAFVGIQEKPPAVLSQDRRHRGGEILKSGSWAVATPFSGEARHAEATVAADVGLVQAINSGGAR
jgi:hypothetical protein